MIDVSKIADIVLLMIDGNYGFEMETMEFLNTLSSSGMPGNVFGILTHLDLFKKASALRDAKKRLKHRFWSELYHGAKLFYLSGVINGRYPDREVHNLSRFISVMKNPRPLIWRNSHPYCLADRFVDLTPPRKIEENAKCDRVVALYGYLRGTNFPGDGARVHIPGVGDLSVSQIESLPDPCPTPMMDQALAKASGKTQRRKLGDTRSKSLFAPMSDVGGVLVDKDAVYVDMKTSTFDLNNDQTGERGLGEQMMMDLQGGRKLLGEDDRGVRLFSGGGTVAQRLGEGDSGRKEKRHGRIVERDDDDDDDFMNDYEEEDEGFVSGDESGSNVDEQEFTSSRLGKVFKDSADHKSKGQEVEFADSDSDIGSVFSVEDQELEGGVSGDEDDELGELQWKENLVAKAKHSHKTPNMRTLDLAKMLYDESITPAEAVRKWIGDARNSVTVDNISDDEDENFFRKSNKKEDKALDRGPIPEYDYDVLKERWSNEENIEILRQRFASAHLTGANAIPTNGDLDGSDIEGDSEGDGGFEDLEAPADGTFEPKTPEDEGEDSLDAERERNARRKEELKLRFEEEDREGFFNDKANERQEGGDEQEFGEDEWYDEQKAKMQKQLAVNRAEFDALDESSRAHVEGYKAGTYARIVLENVPCEFVTNFSARFPILIGGLTATEERFGFVQIRIKRHRWHKKILKTNDPLIFSLGWRRFQTLPLYSISDSRTRNRMLKVKVDSVPIIVRCTNAFCFSTRRSISIALQLSTARLWHQIRAFAVYNPSGTRTLAFASRPLVLC